MSSELTAYWSSRTQKARAVGTLSKSISSEGSDAEQNRNLRFPEKLGCDVIKRACDAWVKKKKRKHVMFMHSQDSIKQGEVLNQVTIMIT